MVRFQGAALKFFRVIGIRVPGIALCFVANAIDLLITVSGKWWNSPHSHVNGIGFCTLLTKRSPQAERAQLLEAIKSLDQQLDVKTCVHLLQMCGKLRALSEGRWIHGHIRKVGLERYLFVANHLIIMYGKCRSVAEARTVFDGMHERNVFTWTVMMGACAQHGHAKEALSLFQQMLRQGIEPHDVTFVDALNACCSPEYLAEGRALHAQLTSYGFQTDVVVATALVTMYSKCGSVEDSEKMFNSMKERNVVSWNAMIAAYAEHGRGADSLQVLRKMQLEGLQTNNVTYISLMSAYDHPSHLKYALHIHDCILQSGFDQDVSVGTTLVNMFAKCSSLENAKWAFDRLREPNVVTWNVLIAAYVQHGYYKEAMTLFRKMQLSGLDSDNITFINIFGACSSPAALADGKMIHACVRERGLESDDTLRSVILNMYGKCASIEDAEAMFDSMPERNLVSWNTMIASYAQHGHSHQALQLFERMTAEGMVPDHYTYVSVLDACATLGALEEGKSIHRQLGDSAFESNALGNALVNMYGKCGILETARSIFDKMQKGAVTWNAMIGAYAHHGHGDESFELFLLMLLEGIEPSHITFISILSACAHGGLLEKGHGYFVSIDADHGMLVGAGHYGCMVDLFGKAGRLQDAETLIQEMPFEADFMTWTAFLGACKSHGDMERGKSAAKRAIELEPDCATPYVSLANLCADSGKWDEALKIRKLMLDRGVRKDPGRSTITLNDGVHEFTVGDQSHPMTKEIYAELRRLDKEMKQVGYAPDMKMVVHNVEEVEKEPLLFCHSERLAIAFGIISSPPRTPIRVMKNLRVCSDCHTVTKFTSKIVGREIIVRDSNRFHHFKDGACSCKDYW